MHRSWPRGRPGAVTRWCYRPSRGLLARFFGRETISLLFILPIALPGIITGISLRSAFDIMGIDFSIWTIVLGHATFCIVVVYNNAVARLRRGMHGDEFRRIHLGIDLGRGQAGMAQQILNVILVYSVCAKTRRKRSSQIVPDNSSGLCLAINDLRSLCRLLQSPI